MTEDRLIMRIVIIFGTTVSSFIAVAVIASVVIVTIWNPELKIPDVLRDWGGLIIGFYFGSFVTLIKDLFRTSPKPNNIDK